MPYFEIHFRLNCRSSHENVRFCNLKHTAKSTRNGFIQSVKYTYCIRQIDLFFKIIPIPHLSQNCAEIENLQTNTWFWLTNSGQSIKILRQAIKHLSRILEQPRLLNQLYRP